MSLPAAEDDGGSSIVQRGVLDANSEALAAEFKARRQAKDKAREAPPTRTVRRASDAA